MASIKPFKALLPTRDKVHLVATRSYISYTEEALNDKLKNNPYTFLHVINPEFSSPSKPNDTRDKYEKVRDSFKSYVSDGVYRNDDDAHFYIYQQIKDGHMYTGIVGGASIDDYADGKIKKHEHTLTEREEMFKSYLDKTQINAEPVLLTYPDRDDLDHIIASCTEERPEFDFTSTDRVRHRFWIVKHPNHIDAISRSFEGVDSLYIADGHHRSASSALLGLERRKNASNTEFSSNYFMVYLLPESQIQIYDFNRLVTDLNGLTPDAFLSKLSNSFHIEGLDDTYIAPQKEHYFTMYLDGKWYSLLTRENSFDNDDPVASLDAEILSQNVLDPILGIRDLKTDKRVAFRGGMSGCDPIKEEVDNGTYSVAFMLYPVAIEHLKWVADTNSFMPPKTTWIEPKLRSGLVVYPLN